MRTAVVSRVLVGGLSPFLLLACAPNTPPAQPPPPAPTAAVLPMATPTVDMSPVEQPKGIAGLIRVKSAKATMTTLEKVLKLPITLEDLLARELHDPDMVKILKLDASVDGAVQLDPAAKEMSPEVLAAFSIPLRDFQEARRVAETRGKVSDRRGGMFSFQPKGMHGGACVVAPSLGDAPARLVCGQRDRDLEALLPWMTRGLSTTPLGASDLHAEIRLVPVQQQFRGVFENKSMIGSLVTMAISRFSPVQDPVLSDVVGDAAAEGVAFVGDLEVLTLDGSIDPGGSGATLVAKAKYAKTDSWLSKSLNQKNDKMALAPAMFWSAPKNADTVTYALGGDPKLGDPVKKRLAELASSLTKAKLGDADRKAVEDLVRSIPVVDAPSVSASGHIDPPAPKAGEKAPPSSGGDDKSVQEKVDAAVGWRITGIETDSKAWANWVSDFAALYNRAGVQKAIKGVDAKAAKVLTVKKVGAGGFPAGSTVVEITVDPSAIGGGRSRFDTMPPPLAPLGSKGVKLPKPVPVKVEKTKPVTLRLVVVPDGARTWIGFASNPDALKAPLKAALLNAPKEGQIGSRTDLDVFKTTPLIGGGFIAPRGVVEAALRRAPNPEAVTAVVRGLPNKGETPLLLLMSGTAGPAPSQSFELRVQKGTLDDLASIALLAGLADKKR